MGVFKLLYTLSETKGKGQVHIEEGQALSVLGRKMPFIIISPLKILRQYVYLQSNRIVRWIIA